MSGLMSGIWKRSNSCCHRARSRLYYAVDAGRLPLTTGLHGSPQDRSYQATCVTTQFQRLRNRALTITRCSSRSCARELISCGGRGELLVTEFVGFEGFIVNFVKRGDATVPFGQCGSVANELDGMRVHLSHRVEHLDDRGCRGCSSYRSPCAGGARRRIKLGGKAISTNATLPRGTE